MVVIRYFVFAVLLGAIGWVGFNYLQNKLANEQAREIYRELCQINEIAERPIGDEWAEIYQQIKEGKFSDQVHLRRNLESPNGLNEWPVDGTDRVFLERFEVSFMDTDRIMVFRNPQFLEHDFIGGPLAQGFQQHSCFYEYHKAFDAFIYS